MANSRKKDLRTDRPKNYPSHLHRVNASKPRRKNLNAATSFSCAYESWAFERCGSGSNTNQFEFQMRHWLRSIQIERFKRAKVGRHRRPVKVAERRYLSRLQIPESFQSSLVPPSSELDTKDDLVQLHWWLRMHNISRDHESPPNPSRIQPRTRKNRGRDDIPGLSPLMKVRRSQAVREAEERGK